MTLSIFDWIRYSHTDYLAGRTSATGRAVTVGLLSQPGTGKSTIVETVLPNHLEETLFPGESNETEPEDRPQGSYINWGMRGMVAVVSENTPGRDMPDIRGFMVPRKDNTSSYTKPDLVTTVEACYNAGAELVVLFLDELPASDHLSQKAYADVCLNHRFGSYTLDPRSWVIFAGNRTKDNSGALRMFAHLVNRCSIHEVRTPIYDANPAAPASNSAWTNWALKQGFPPLVVAFARQWPGKVSTDAPPKEGPFPTLRSVTHAALWLAQFKQDIGDTADPMTVPLGKPGGDNPRPEYEYAQGKIAGMVGEALANDLAAYVQVANELAPLKEIVADPTTARIPGRSRIDAVYAQAMMLGQQVTSQNCAALWEYAMRMPKEFQVRIAKDMLDQTGGTLMNHPALAKWISKNKALIYSSLA